MKLFHRHYGEGTPVIILHGIFGISDNWVSIGRRIAERFSVFILDQRNHGQSPHSDYFTYPAMVEDLREFIDEHDLEHPVIIGHSMGGKVAMNFALEYPQEVEKLIIVDISPRAYPGRQVHQRMLEAMLAVNFDEVKTREEIDQLLQSAIESKRIRQFILKNLQRVNKDRLGWRLNVKSLNENLFNAFEGVAMGRQYTGPTLFVRGGASDYISQIDLPLISSLFPNAEVKTIPGASHWVHADAPDELCALLSDFLGKQCDMSFSQ